MTHLCKLAAGMGLISARYARFDQAHTGFTERIFALTLLEAMMLFSGGDSTTTPSDRTVPWATDPFPKGCAGLCGRFGYALANALARV